MERDCWRDHPCSTSAHFGTFLDFLDPFTHPKSAQIVLNVSKDYPFSGSTLPAPDCWCNIGMVPNNEHLWLIECSICNQNPKRNLEILVQQKQRQDAEICVFPQNTWHAAKYLACKKLSMQKKKKICISLMICSFFLIANIWFC